ncbi:MAG TPA: hypothetical protein VFF33_06940 [Ignavibacteriaceae bacterium]|nr:hypothetical protein [Ignavibacteriaceae bacterium]
MVALFVVLMFALFIVIDYFVLKAQGKTHPAFTTFKVFDKKSFLFPEDVVFSTGHTWMKKLNDNIVKLGIDEFILKSLANISLKNLVAEGTQVNKGDYILEGKFGGRSIKFKSPLTGTVKSINRNLETKKVDNPYEDDWGLTIEASKMNEEMASTKSQEKAIKWLQEEFNRLKDFLSFHINDAQLAGVTMQDGGNIVEGALAHLNDKAIEGFQNDFLNK